MSVYVDTNILVRIMTNDNPSLAKRAFESIGQYGSGDLIITGAVMSELFFVLENSPLYKFSRKMITESFDDIVLTPQFHLSVDNYDAFRLFAEHPKLDFVDCLLAVKAKRRRAHVLTYDKDLLAILK